MSNLQDMRNDCDICNKKDTPMRRCVGCMTSFPKEELIRLALIDGVIRVDQSGNAEGRGIYVCHKERCFQIASKKKAWARMLKVPIDAVNVTLLEQDLKDLWEPEEVEI